MQLKVKVTFIRMFAKYLSLAPCMAETLHNLFLDKGQRQTYQRVLGSSLLMIIKCLSQHWKSLYLYPQIQSFHHFSSLLFMMIGSHLCLDLVLALSSVLAGVHTADCGVHILS